MYSHIMMDLDGTIYDFDCAEKMAFFKSCDDFKISVNDEIYSIYRGINDDMWRRLELGTIKREELIVLRFKDLFNQLKIENDPVKINKRYLSLLMENIKVFEGVYNVLSKLSQKYTLCAITNGASQTQWAKLKKTDTKKYFDKIFISEEMGVQKPQKEFFDIVTNYYSSVPRENFLVVGDSLTADVKGANNSSLDCVWINSKNINDEGFHPKYTVNNISDVLNFL